MTTLHALYEDILSALNSPESIDELVKAYLAIASEVDDILDKIKPDTSTAYAVLAAALFGACIDELEGACDFNEISNIVLNNTPQSLINDIVEALRRHLA